MAKTKRKIIRRKPIRKDHSVTIRLTEEELRRLHQAASRTKLPVSEFVLTRCL
jgi:predicted DNA binding CopG/RHH family protein